MQLRAISVFLLCNLAHLSGATQWEWQGSFSNRYVTEGIDNVPDGSAVLFNEFNVSHGLFIGGLTYAQFLDDAYNEINLAAGIAGESGAFGWEATVMFLSFPAADVASTWELGVALSWKILTSWAVFAEVIYDVDAVRGGFMETGIEGDFAINADVTVNPYMLLGIDYGFVSGPRSLRVNNWQVGISADYAINDVWSVVVGLHHSVRLSNLRDLGEGNVTWANIGLAGGF